MGLDHHDEARQAPVALQYLHLALRVAVADRLGVRVRPLPAVVEDHCALVCADGAPAVAVAVNESQKELGEGVHGVLC